MLPALSSPALPQPRRVWAGSLCHVAVVWSHCPASAFCPQSQWRCQSPAQIPKASFCSRLLPCHFLEGLAGQLPASCTPCTRVATVHPCASPTMRGDAAPQHWGKPSPQSAKLVGSGGLELLPLLGADPEGQAAFARGQGQPHGCRTWVAANSTMPGTARGEKSPGRGRGAMPWESLILPALPQLEA